MLQFLYRSVTGLVVLTLGFTVGAIAPSFVAAPTPVLAATPKNTSFPDTQNHWAQPFIHALAQQQIVSGYLDGTYRPDKVVNRDEFAAIIRDAFNQKQERKIGGGSVYKDVPKGYWAAPAIESAYEMGFMHGYPGGYFRPHQPVTKVEAIAALAQNLNLKSAAPLPPVAAVPPSTNQAPAPQATAAQPMTNVQTRRRRAVMYPMAMTMLMQPFVNRPALANVASVPSSAQPSTATQPTAIAPSQAMPLTAPAPASALVSKYYADADQIPQYAVDAVAAATRSGIVVNYPNLRLLNPNQPATRGEIAALVYRALVSQGKAAPIANQAAAKYVVGQR